ncbi:MAG: hypothetical protein WA962_03010 [Ornithinimicrobium sp.]
MILWQDGMDIPPRHVHRLYENHKRAQGVADGLDDRAVPGAKDSHGSPVDHVDTTKRRYARVQWVSW